jgi:hypothetical protein
MRSLDSKNHLVNLRLHRVIKVPRWTSVRKVVLEARVPGELAESRKLILCIVSDIT